jgi:hypothetical protein
MTANVSLAGNWPGQESSSLLPLQCFGKLDLLARLWDAVASQRLAFASPINEFVPQALAAVTVESLVNHRVNPARPHELEAYVGGSVQDPEFMGHVLGELRGRSGSASAYSEFVVWAILELVLEAVEGQNPQRSTAEWYSRLTLREAIAVAPRVVPWTDARFSGKPSLSTQSAPSYLASGNPGVAWATESGVRSRLDHAARAIQMVGDGAPEVREVHDLVLRRRVSWCGGFEVVHSVTGHRYYRVASLGGCVIGLISVDGKTAHALYEPQLLEREAAERREQDWMATIG